MTRKVGFGDKSGDVPTTRQASTTNPSGDRQTSRKGNLVGAVILFGMVAFGIAMIIRGLQGGQVMMAVFAIFWTVITFSIFAKTVLAEFGVGRKASRHRHEWSDE